jgi:hypothetical protein
MAKTIMFTRKDEEFLRTLKVGANDPRQETEICSSFKALYEAAGERCRSLDEECMRAHGAERHERALRKRYQMATCIANGILLLLACVPFGPRWMHILTGFSFVAVIWQCTRHKKDEEGF